MFFVLLVLAVVFSLTAVQASDINSTAADSTDEVSLQIDDSASLDAPDADMDALDESARNQTELVSPSNEIYYKGSYSVTLKDADSGSGLSNKAVDFTINNVKYATTTGNDGVANVNLDLSPGKYTVFASSSRQRTFQNITVQTFHTRRSSLTAMEKPWQILLSP